MKNLLLLLVFSISVSTLKAQCYGNLVWSDEFTTSTVDASKWSYQTGDGCPNLCGWGNSELEYYTNSSNNVYIDNGVLVLKAIKENQGGASFSAGKLITNGKFSRTYGRFEARMRMPSGAGLWPAFWMLPTNNNWPTTGEIDIMEYRGDQTTNTQGTLHYGAAWPNNRYDGMIYNTTQNLTTDFHVYAVEWTADYIKWYFDNTLIKTETKNPNSLDPVSNADAWPWSKDFYIILNLAVGGWFTGVTSAANVQMTKPTFEIDYVRVYDLNTSGNSQVAYNGSAYSVPGKIEAENYDVKCDGAYFDTEGANQGNAYRNDAVDIEVCNDAGGGYDVGWTINGEWLDYTIDVNNSGTYDVDFRIASGAGSGSQMHLLLDNQPLGSSVNVPNTGGWQNWQTVTLHSVSLSKGKHILRLYFDGTNININYLELTDVSVGTTDFFYSSFQVKNTSDKIIFSSLPTTSALRFFDFQGREILVNSFNVNNTVEINKEEFSSGIYIYQLGTKAGKFVID